MAKWDENYAQSYVNDLRRRMDLASAGDPSESASTNKIQAEIDRVAKAWNVAPAPQGVPVQTNVPQQQAPQQVQQQVPQFQTPQLNLTPWQDFQGGDYTHMSYDEAFQKAMEQMNPAYQRDVNRNTREFSQAQGQLAQALNARGQAQGGQRLEGDRELTQQQLLQLDDTRHSHMGRAGELARGMHETDREFAMRREAMDYDRFRDQQTFQRDLELAQWDAAMRGVEFDYNRFVEDRRHDTQTDQFGQEMDLKDRQLDQQESQFSRGFDQSERQFNARLQFDRSQADRNYALAREQLAQQERIASANRAMQERLAQLSRQDSSMNWTAVGVQANDIVRNVQGLLGNAIARSKEDPAAAHIDLNKAYAALHTSGEWLQAVDKESGMNLFDTLKASIDNVTYWGDHTEGGNTYRYGMDPYSGTVLWKDNQVPPSKKNQDFYYEAR